MRQRIRRRSSKKPFKSCHRLNADDVFCGRAPRVYTAAQRDRNSDAELGGFYGHSIPAFNRQPPLSLRAKRLLDCTWADQPLHSINRRFASTVLMHQRHMNMICGEEKEGS
ncbi:hypothetical protein HNY73_012803 [Argiope bruennichi]|uniref:Uncharacterized protein n=1 Tax=Argiope bruennichi TaxID=94029 RepID=A0A8T0EXX3_ARGBR|nr:hypothetical protein HNY73_012803 [Argiope bruennichi]